MVNVPLRQDIPKEQTWNHESVFSSFDDWNEEYQAVEKRMKEIDRYKGTLSQSPEHLQKWFDFYSVLARRVTKVWGYPMMWMECDGNNEAIKGMVGQARSLFGQFIASVSFAEPELLAMDSDTLVEWVNANDRLKVYQQYMTNLLRQKQHVLSADIEEVLGLVSDPLGRIEQIRNALSNMDMTFEPVTTSNGDTVTITQSNRYTLKGDTDRAIRKGTWENYADAYLKYNNTFATSYLASVKKNVVVAQLRGYDSVLHAMLAPNNIPIEVFHNLIDTYKKHIPTWHRYWDVRRRALGYEAIHPYDIWAPFTANEPKLSFNESVEMIATGMKPLGDEYIEIMRRGCLEQRWVDYAVNQGKAEGAFSGGDYDTYPFIMMSFDGTLSSMSTLAHELGHSMHSYNTRKTQPYIYSDYSMFVAEVASNFNQAMIRAHLFAEHDGRDFQLALIQEAMDNIHRYFFIMPTLARFELEVHTRMENNEALTPTMLNQIMADFYAEGYGDTMTDDSVRTGVTWAQFIHLYEPYYTFQYATGISAAHALANVILAGDDSQAVERYLTFLKSGSAEYPIDVLKAAGVDMSTPRPVEETFKVLEQLVDRLESLIE